MHHDGSAPSRRDRVWDALEQLADLKLSSPTRLRIVRRLAEDDDPLSPSAFIRSLPEGSELTIGAVAHHFRDMRDTGVIELVGDRRVRGAVESFYRLSKEYREVIERIVGSVL